MQREQHKNALLLSWVASSRVSRGHWHSYPRALRNHIGKVKFEVASLPGVADDFIPCLRRSFYGKEFSRPRQVEMERQIRALSHLLSSQNFDFVFCYEAGPVNGEVISHLALEFPFTSFLVNLYPSSRWLDLLKDSKSEISHQLSEIARYGNVTFSVDTIEASTTMEKTLGCYVPTLPVFSTLSSGKQQAYEEKSRGHGVLFLVDSWASLSLLYSFLDSRPFLPEVFPMAVIIPPKLGGDPLGKRQNLITGIERFCKVISGAMTEDTYSVVIADYGVCCFFYSTTTYRQKSSGRVEDALVSGAIPVVPAGTSLGRQISGPQGEYCFQFDYSKQSSIRRAITDALEAKRIPRQGKTAHSLENFVLREGQLKEGERDAQIFSKISFSSFEQLQIERSMQGKIGRLLVSLGIIRP